VRGRALHCGLGLLRAWPGLVGGLGVWTADLAQKPGPRGLGLLGYVVKAQARDLSPRLQENRVTEFQARSWVRCGPELSAALILVSTCP
jgi:hypothetical protein